eukprot:TRINITY_DN12518_c0_g1_i8.p1 TRINITY_DN12518_c0_g1~~TRINITY_DN12518_c0_g1_i8.p1  ORF type:complete len:204 (+),score=31.40 TRINITY_DN12518_c0_g1_i8:198-809(+)
MKNLSDVSNNSSAADIASKIAGTYRLEMERACPSYEFHTTTLAAERGNFANMVQQTYACGAQDEPMMIVKTPEGSGCRFDVVTSTLALKRRRGQVDEGIRANKDEIERTVGETAKEIIGTERNSRERTGNLVLVNRILLEAGKRVTELTPELKFGFFVALTTPTTAFEVGTSDTEGSNILRIETRIANSEFSILAVTLIFPNT